MQNKTSEAVPTAAPRPSRRLHPVSYLVALGLGSDSHLRREIGRGKLVPHYVGDSPRFSDDEIDRYQNSLKRPTNSVVG